jgi:hypothetical protein
MISRRDPKPRRATGERPGANPFTNDFKEILLIGPLGFAEQENRFSGKRGLVIAKDQA